MQNIREVSFPIPFAQGLDTKTDPKQVQVGKFLSLNNMVFTNQGLLQKRNGYKTLSTLVPSASYLTTLNGNLTAIGSTVSAYSASLNKWVDKGTTATNIGVSITKSLEPCALNVLSLIKNSFNQIQADSIVSSSGLVCTTYTELNDVTNTYKYAIADSTTGQNIVEPNLIPPIAGGVISGSSRVFIVGTFFVIVSQVLVGGTTFLQYIAIPVANPVNPNNTPNVSAPQSVTAEAYVPTTSNPGWDGAALNNTSQHVLIIAYNSTTTAQGLHIAALTQAQIAANQATATIKQYNNPAYVAALVTVCTDLTSNPTFFYIAFWNPASHVIYVTAVTYNNAIIEQFPPMNSFTQTAVANLASGAQFGFCGILMEVHNVYGYDSAIDSNYINSFAISSLGVVVGNRIIIRSVGLASKAFIFNEGLYVLTAQHSTFQDTYFLIDAALSTDANPLVVAKLAYENGGGYVHRGLPGVTIAGPNAQIAYLFKDLIEPLATLGNTQQSTTGGVYAQTGINLVSFQIGTQNIDTAEIASALQISGGFLGMYDGYSPVEQNFFLWPENVEVTTSASGGSITAQEYFYQAIYQWTDNNGLIHRSAPSIPVSVTTTGTTSTNTIDIPTLRLTMKTANPLNILLYRWSTAQEVYYQVTSVIAPLVNDTTIDFVTFTDTFSDTDILGNSIIYTTGGVVEDINAPASNGILTLFDTRLWTVDAEDPNLLWYSKQVIEGTPVEMSDLFTIFVAPNAGTIGDTGPITALAPMDDKLIIFKKNAIYYINGSGPDNTGANSGYSQPIFITSTVGCTNQHSIVLADGIPGQTDGGLMFQSDKGIWMLDRGLATVYVGAPVEAFNSSIVNSANSIPETNQVRFTLNTGETLLYDYYYGQWATFTGVPAISSCIYQGVHTIINKYGTIYQETPGIYLDGTSPVLMSFVTGWIQLQGIAGYQRIYETQLLGSYISPHLLDVKLAYDFGAPSEQAVITPTNATGEYGSDDFFGQTTPFGGPGSLEQWRIQPSRQVCQTVQVSLNEIYDMSLGVQAGAGFTLSAMTCTLGLLRGYRPVKGANTTGTSN